MTTTMPGSEPATASLLAAAVRLLAAHGESAVADVLGLATHALGCDDLVLRDAAAMAVVARAAGPVPVQRPAGERWVLDAAVRCHDGVLGVLTATAGSPFTPDRAAGLTAVADALALCLAAAGRRTGGWGRRAAGQAVLDAEADRALLVAGLHERVEDALVAVRYAAALAASGRAEVGGVEEPARAALDAVRHVRRDLRAHALEAGLRSALVHLAARSAGDRPDDGHPMARVEVHATDPALDSLAPPVAVTVERVAEAVLRGATGQASVRATIEQSTVKLRVDSADIACDASEIDRWARRVQSLGGALRLWPAGVELTLPVATEGSHDDGPDL